MRLGRSGVGAVSSAPHLALVASFAMAVLLAYALAAPTWAQQGEASVFVARGVLAYDAKRYEEALQSFREALRLEPNNVDALYYTGLTNIALKRYDQAAEALEQARARDPRDQSITFQLGALYFGMERYDRAKPLLEEVFASNPRLDSLGYYVGFLRYRQKDYQGALRAFRAGTSALNRRSPSRAAATAPRRRSAGPVSAEAGWSLSASSISAVACSGSPRMPRARPL